MDLVTWLRMRQKQLGLTDTAFARKLGIDQSTWWYISHEKRAVGRRVIRKILEAFPEDRNTIIDLLLSDGSANDGTPNLPSALVVTQVA